MEAIIRLDEELTDQEAKELQDIIKSIQGPMNEPEFLKALPAPVSKRLQSNFSAAQGVLKDRGLNAEPKKDEPKKDEPKKDVKAEPLTPGVDAPRDAAAVAADPDGDGNADDPEAQVFASGAATPTAARQLKIAILGAGTDENTIFKVLSQVKTPADWAKLQKEYKDDTGNDLVADLQSDLDSTDMERYVWDPLRKANVNKVTPTNAAPTSQGPADDVAAGVKSGGVDGGKVPPRPTGVAAYAWIQKYGKTHNDDGTPK
jgi:hypothetical protein